MTRVVGVVLAGGLATRMGGGPKALLRVGGQTLMDHVIKRLQAQVPDIAINANADLERYEDFGFPILRDTIAGHLGPLAGVLAGLRWAQTKGATHVVSVAGDTPFFPDDLVVRLLAAIDPDHPIALAATLDPERGALRQPTFGLWPVDLADDLEEALSDGLRKIVAWTDRHGTGIAEFSPEPFDPFFNVNTPDDRLRAEELAAEFTL